MIYQAAAKGMKRVTMELGGKSPNIVFDDAEIDNAVKGVISGIFAATGQTCIAGSRLLVQKSIHDQFVDKLVALAATAKMGNPMNADTQVGPVTNPPQFRKILDYLDIAKGEGAQPVLESTRMRRRLVRRADDIHRREQPHAHRTGRSVRAGAVRHPVRG
jgi:aldehyde dehydrogenase (NAD+)